jgi:hypothetical protein
MLGALERGQHAAPDTGAQEGLGDARHALDRPASGVTHAQAELARPRANGRLAATERGGDGDGWLHALFRYRHRNSGHVAETSFGAHIFNTLTVYRDEPQSYSGRPPGLSTRLFLRLGVKPYDTLCHLIYPASRPWRPESVTEITLYDATGTEVARTGIAIPCSGSRLLRYHALFDAASRERAGSGAYAIIRDSTCRLFGYHGLLGRDGSFSLDHMFGF